MTRGFRHRVVALAMTAVIASACGGDDSTTTDATDGVEDETGGRAADGTTSESAEGVGMMGRGETPDPGDYDRDATFVYAVSVAPSSLNIHKALYSGNFIPVLSLLYDRLVYIDPYTGEQQPMLAESWEVSDDDTTITFHLRDDVEYHDGVPMTAESVVANIEHGKSLGEAHPVAAQYTVVDDAVAVDEHTLELTVNPSVIGAIPEFMAGPMGMPMSPEAFDRDDDNEYAAGTGPYRLVDVRPGESYVYEPVEDFYDPDAQTVAELQILIEDNEDTVLNGVAAGQIDAAKPSASVQGRAESLGVSVITEPSNTSWVLNINTERVEGADDPRLLEALNMAIDREAISAGPMQGNCTPTVQPYNPLNPFHNPDYEADHYPYDPDAARALLGEAGLDGEVSIEIDTYTVPIYTPVAEVLQSQFEAIGVKTEIQTLDSSQLTSGYRVDKTLDTFLSRTPYNQPPLATVANTWLPESSHNPGAWHDEELVDLYEQATAEVDPDAQTELLRNISARLVEAPSPSIQICHETSTHLAGDDVIGLRTPQAGYIDFRILGKAAG